EFRQEKLTRIIETTSTFTKVKKDIIKKNS
ncbi:unnamed protein product, partial [marine sediment metagenome]